MNNYPRNNFGGMGSGYAGFGGMGSPGNSPGNDLDNFGGHTYAGIYFPPVMLNSPSANDPWDFRDYAPPENYSRRTDIYPQDWAQADADTMNGFPINGNTHGNRLQDFINAARHRIQYWSRRIHKRSNPGFPENERRGYEPFDAPEFLEQLEARLDIALEEQNRRARISQEQYQERLTMEASGLLPPRTTDWARFPADPSTLQPMGHPAMQPMGYPANPPPTRTERTQRTQRSSGRTERRTRK